MLYAQSLFGFFLSFHANLTSVAHIVRMVVVRPFMPYVWVFFVGGLGVRTVTMHC